MLRICFLLIITVGTSTSVFKENKYLGSHKTVEIKVFLIFLLVDGRIRICTINYESGSGTGMPQKNSDPGLEREFFKIPVMQLALDRIRKWIWTPGNYFSRYLFCN